MSKDQWIADHERACDDLWDGYISEEEFTARMKELGFDPSEIEEHIDAYHEDVPQ